MAPVRHFTQLIVWQLGEQIRVHVLSLTKQGGFASDFKARGQAEDAADSVCRNIAEGFGCESHDEFARHLEIARRSLNELRDELHAAQLKEYVNGCDLAPIGQLSNRIYPAFSRLIAYLRNNPNPKRRPSRRRGDTRQRARTDARKKDRTDKRK